MERARYAKRGFICWVCDGHEGSEKKVWRHQGSNHCTLQVGNKPHRSTATLNECIAAHMFLRPSSRRIPSPKRSTKKISVGVGVSVLSFLSSDNTI